MYFAAFGVISATGTNSTYRAVWVWSDVKGECDMRNKFLATLPNKTRREVHTSCEGRGARWCRPYNAIIRATEL